MSSTGKFVVRTELIAIESERDFSASRRTEFCTRLLRVRTINKITPTTTSATTATTMTAMAQLGRPAVAPGHDAGNGLAGLDVSVTVKADGP